MISSTDAIEDCYTITTILKKIDTKTDIYLDLDNTVMETCLELGSDQWYEALIKLIPVDTAIEMYNEIQHLLKSQPVEPVIIHLIKSLQHRGNNVIGVTARDERLKETTIRQLRAIGVDFGSDNIIFCSDRNKGLVVKEKLLTKKEKPEKIVMADDKVKNLIDVHEVATSLGISFHGFHYRFCDEKVKSLEMDHAHSQLQLILHELPLSLQTKIKDLNLVPKTQIDFLPRDFRFFTVKQAETDEEYIDLSMLFSNA